MLFINKMNNKKNIFKLIKKYCENKKQFFIVANVNASICLFVNFSILFANTVSIIKDCSSKNKLNFIV